MRFLFPILLLLTSCGAIYETEKSLQDKLSWYIGKGQSDLTTYLGIASQQNLYKNYIELIFVIKAKEGSTEDLYKNSCILTFKIDRTTGVINKAEYDKKSQKCYGIGAVYINSNFR